MYFVSKRDYSMVSLCLLLLVVTMVVLSSNLVDLRTLAGNTLAQISGRENNHCLPDEPLFIFFAQKRPAR